MSDAVFSFGCYFWCKVSDRCPLLLQSPCWIRMENTFLSRRQLQFFFLVLQILEILLCFNSNRRISKVKGKRKSIMGIKSRPELFWFGINLSSLFTFCLADPCRGIKWLKSGSALENENGIDLLVHLFHIFLAVPQIAVPASADTRLIMVPGLM